MNEVNETLAEEVKTEAEVALEVSEELFPTETSEATEPELRGSTKLAEIIEIKGNQVPQKDVVMYAFAKSKLTVDIWNKLSGQKREVLLEAAIDDLRKELKPVPKNQDGKPRLSIEEKNKIKESKYKKEVAGQQWAALGALKDKINYAPDKKNQKRFNQGQSKKGFVPAKPISSRDLKK